MAAIGRKQGIAMAATLMKTLTRPPSSSVFGGSIRSLMSWSGGVDVGVLSSEIITSHTDKWMQDTSKKSPMQLINEVPPIKVEGRIVACEGDSNPALGHPIEFICLDLDEPAVCKYCGLRYVHDHGSHHH